MKLLPFPVLPHYFLLLPELETSAFPSSDNYDLTAKPTSPVFQMNQLFFFFSDALTDAGINAGSLVSCYVFVS